MTSEVDVVIVGAGAAGLAAAKSAASHGLSFVVLEASHRIGGRARTEEIAPGQPFDLGCHWMHSASINPFVGIADRLGFRYRRKRGWNDVIHHYGAFLDDDQARDLDALLEADERAIAEAARHGDPALADVMNTCSPWAPYHAYWRSLESSCDPDQTGVTDFVAYDETDEDWPVVDGYGALVAAWATDVPVTLDAPARRIVMTPDGVAVETPRGTITGRTALVTVSTGVLASGRIGFEPELPSWKTTAAREVPLGVHNKIAVLLNPAHPHLPEPRFLTAMMRDHGVPLALNVRPYGYDYVVGTTAGRFGDALERTGRDASVEFLVEHLKAVFGNGIARCLTGRSIVTAWRGDPWTLGGYSAPRPGQAHQREVLARPVDDRLFFAGEATTRNTFATCHGALLTGRRAVTEIVARLRGTDGSG